MISMTDSTYWLRCLCAHSDGATALAGCAKMAAFGHKATGQPRHGGWLFFIILLAALFVGAAAGSAAETSVNPDVQATARPNSLRSLLKLYRDSQLCRCLCNDRSTGEHYCMYPAAAPYTAITGCHSSHGANSFVHLTQCWSAELHGSCRSGLGRWHREKEQKQEAMQAAMQKGQVQPQCVPPIRAKTLARAKACVVLGEICCTAKVDA